MNRGDILNNINIPILLLASLIVSMFTVTGIAIAYSNLLIIFSSFLLGCLTMGYGIALKKKSDS